MIHLNKPNPPPGPDPERLKARVAGRQFARDVLSTGEDVVTVRGPDFAVAYWETIEQEAELAQARLGVKKATPPQEKKPKPNRRVRTIPDGWSEQGQLVDVPDDVAKALELIDEMEELASEIEWEDAADVLEKAQSIGSTIERAGSVTGPQMEALENMLSGMQRWVRD